MDVHRSYGYDAASNRTGFTDPENGSTSYVYDTLNRLQTLTPPSAFTTGRFGFELPPSSAHGIMRHSNHPTAYFKLKPVPLELFFKLALASPDSRRSSAFQ